MLRRHDQQTRHDAVEDDELAQPDQRHIRLVRDGD